MTLSLSQDVDDSKIDSSNAKVELVAGDGYTTTELCFAATQLTGSWQNGQLEYTLGVDDLTWDNSQYAITETSGCSSEWSCFGGDGAGNYYFNLQVSGILYDGTEIPSQIIPVHVYIYRSFRHRSGRYEFWHPVSCMEVEWNQRQAYSVR